MRLPILLAHDHRCVLGTFLYDVNEHRHCVVFKPFTVTTRVLLMAKTGWSFRILEEATRDGITYVHKIELLEISL
jgi:hypothetical protein